MEIIITVMVVPRRVKWKLDSHAKEAQVFVLLIAGMVWCILQSNVMISFKEGAFLIVVVLPMDIPVFKAIKQQHQYALKLRHPPQPLLLLFHNHKLM